MYDDTPPMQPRTGDYAAMLARATRRRRQRRLRHAAAVASLAAMAVTAQALPRGDMPASLHVANETADESPEPSPEATPTPERPTPSPSATSVPPPPRPYPTESQQPPRRTPSPSPSVSRPAQTRPPYATHRAVYAYVPGAAPEDCQTAEWARDAPDSPNWCAVYAGPASFASYEDAVLTVRLCRSAARRVGAGTLTTYSSGSWLKARLVDGPWHWYSEVKTPDVPSITVQPGDCAEWGIAWNAPVEPGTYTLNPVFIVNEFKPHPQPEFEVEVTKKDNSE